MLSIIGRKVKFTVNGTRLGHIVSVFFPKVGRPFFEVYGTCEGGSGFPDYYEYSSLIDIEYCDLEFIS